MITLNLDNNKTIICNSNWDSGVHTGFELVTQEHDSYSSKSLDKVLSKGQIKALEMLLATTAKQFIEGEL